MTLSDLTPETVRFRTSDEVIGDLRDACEANPDLASFEIIGKSEEGRPIAGITLGSGPRLVTLVAGAHADEPIGPETLRHLIVDGLGSRDWGAEVGGLASLFERVTFRIIPHVNPDAEARNQPWISRWNALAENPAALLGLFLHERRREPPGRDIEFGYPAMRAENRAATEFLFAPGPPLAIHASLHGMAVSEGALLLIEKEWLRSPRCAPLRDGFVRAARAAGLRLHDHDRGGDKGFRYGGPGFWSTPEGAAMRAHFDAIGDTETASLFHRSSMEQAIHVSGGHPLCLVTELPLFVLGAEYPHEPGIAALSAEFARTRPDLLQAATEADGQARLGEAVERFGIWTLGPTTAVRLHLTVLDLALGVSGNG